MSSETPKPSTKKIKSALNRKQWFLILSGIVLGLVVFGVWIFSGTPNQTISISNFAIETVNTEESRMQGLSERASFSKNQAMIFDFSDGGNGRCFWMKEMNFDIDIIWLDNNKRVQKVVANASPDSYPKESFCADKNPRYVIELSAGRAQELDIKRGGRVEF